MSSHNAEWILQLNSRRKWLCDECSSQHQIFSSPTELNDHINANHKEIPRVQIAAMLENNIIVLKGDPSLCPFCKSTQGTTEQVARHTAQHLRSLAWLSVRYLDDSHSASTHHEQHVSLAEESDEAQLGTIRGSDDLLTISSGSPDLVNPTKSPNSEGLLSGYSDPNERVGRTEEHSEEYTVGKSDPERLSMSESEQKSEITLERIPVPAELPLDKKSSNSRSIKTTPGKRVTARTLARQIQELMVESPLDAKRFLPRTRINELITPANIAAVIGSDIETEPCVKFISRSAKIFFAIILSIRMDVKLAVETLYRFGLTDEFLPISEDTIEDNCEEDDVDRRCGHDHALDAFHDEPWDHLTLSDFYEKQWRFLAPVFTTDEFKVFHLSTNSIFPFVDLGTQRRSSLFSDVYEVKIHPDHITPVGFQPIQIPFSLIRLVLWSRCTICSQRTTITSGDG